MNRSKKYEFSPENRNLLESLQHPLAAYQLIDDKICTLLISDGMCHMCAMDRDSIIELFNTDMYRGTHPDDVARVAELAHRFIINENEYDNAPMFLIQGWEDLSLLEEFPEHEQQRLRYYLSFH